MRHILGSICAIGIGLAAAGGAQAQLFRAYVSSDGSDSNPCTLPAPCRLLPAALAAVASGGEIWMLDSANYNATAVNVDKSVTILAIPGAVGSVVAIGGPALQIATPSVKVILRNLVVVPFPGGGGTYGVFMTNGSELTVEGCTFTNLVGYWGVAVTNAAKVRIANTTITGGYGGVQVSGGASLDISGSRLYGMSFYGLQVAGNVASVVTRGAVSDSMFSGNGGGILAYASAAGSLATITVMRSTVANNQYGVYSQGAGGQTLVTLGSNMVTGSTLAGFAQTGTNSAINSLGNNVFAENAAGLGSLTIVGGN